MPTECGAPYPTATSTEFCKEFYTLGDEQDKSRETTMIAFTEFAATIHQFMIVSMLALLWRLLMVRVSAAFHSHNVLQNFGGVVGVSNRGRSDDRVSGSDEICVCPPLGTRKRINMKY